MKTFIVSYAMSYVKETYIVVELILLNGIDKKENVAYGELFSDKGRVKKSGGKCDLFPAYAHAHAHAHIRYCK